MATLNAKFKRKNGSDEDIIHFETSWTKVLNKPSTFTPTAHNHSATEITSGLGYTPARVQERVVSDMNHADYRVSGMYGVNGAPANTYGETYGALIVAANLDTGLQIAGGHDNDDLYFRGWSGGGSTYTAWRKVWHAGNLTNLNQLTNGPGYVTASHTHDDRYYTETEVNTLLAGKAASSHTHTFASLTSKPTTKAGYGITDVYTITQIQSMLTNKSDLEHGHDADQIQSGILSTLRIPNLDTSKLTSGTLGVARGGTGRSSLTSGSVLVGNGTSAVSLVSRSGIDSRSTFPPSTHGHNVTLTYLGERTTMGISTIAAIANYTQFYVSFNVEWGDGLRTDTGTVFKNVGIASTMVYDTYNQAPIMINASVDSDNKFKVNDSGVMPYAMLTGASLLQVQLYGVTIQ